MPNSMARASTTAESARAALGARLHCPLTQARIRTRNMERQRAPRASSSRVRPAGFKLPLTVVAAGRTWRDKMQRFLQTQPVQDRKAARSRRVPAVFLVS